MADEEKEENVTIEEKKTEQTQTENNSTLAEEIVTEFKKFFTFDILNYIKKPWKLIGLNFFMGLVRGIGFFLGMTIVGAIVFTLLLKTFHKIAAANIPLLSAWIAKLDSMVNENLKMVQ